MGTYRLSGRFFVKTGAPGRGSYSNLHGDTYLHGRYSFSIKFESPWPQDAMAACTACKDPHGGYSFRRWCRSHRPAPGAQGEEGLHLLRVEHLPRLIAEILQRFLLRDGLAIRAVRTHRVPDIDDGENARPQGAKRTTHKGNCSPARPCPYPVPSQRSW
jgi:hypothetical protein